MTIEETRDGNRIQLSVTGKIDTLTSPNFQDAVLKAFQKGNQLIIDFRQVEYISSAGLRALILGQKTAQSKRGSMVILNAQPAVLDVFKVTGFERILTLQ